MKNIFENAKPGDIFKGVCCTGEHEYIYVADCLTCHKLVESTNKFGPAYYVNRFGHAMHWEWGDPNILTK